MSKQNEQVGVSEPWKPWGLWRGTPGQATQMSPALAFESREDAEEVARASSEPIWTVGARDRSTGFLDAREPASRAAPISPAAVHLGLRADFVTGEQKRDRAQMVLLAAADRRIEDVARALVKLTEGFRELDFQQLEDAIPPEVWDGLVQAMAEYRRKELVGR